MERLTLPLSCGAYQTVSRVRSKYSSRRRQLKRMVRPRFYCHVLVPVSDVFRPDLVVVDPNAASWDRQAFPDCSGDRRHKGLALLSGASGFCLNEDDRHARLLKITSWRQGLEHHPNVAWRVSDRARAGVTDVLEHRRESAGISRCEGFYDDERHAASPPSFSANTSV